MRILFAILASLCLTCQAADVNLTPLPRQMTMGEGTLTLTPQLRVSYASLPDSLAREAARFVSDLNAGTGLDAIASESKQALIRMEVDEQAAPEGYSLDITTKGATLRARTAAGFFYGFQSILKMLPANVLGRHPQAGATYSLPVMQIQDEPRFGYRGFMLDVSRHFFSVEELERIIDLMSVYKMNAFHWHLTDDQGWRIEIKKYPKLTTTGATRANNWVVDMDKNDGQGYWTDQTYGPYFYTQAQIREVVQYCHQRHIRVIPEVDMPGHFVAAMAAYPEYSCSPQGEHAVWTGWGVSSDVLNVANPRAVQFAKDILSEVMDLFPDGVVHIGGDECPTDAWQNNAECQALYQQRGLQDYRQLQSLFIKEMTDHLASRGYRTYMWNESITAGGADLDLMQKTGATVMCWNPCQKGALKAAQLGLQAIITEYHSANGGYYINRRQSNQPGEPSGAGKGDDTVEGCYNYVPVPSSVDASLVPYYIGVQGTFWTEHVANNRYLEYLALPRLMAVAEAGWTPQDLKNFDSFRTRMTQDTLMLDMRGLEYARHIFK